MTCKAEMLCYRKGRLCLGLSMPLIVCLRNKGGLIKKNKPIMTYFYENSQLKKIEDRFNLRTI